MYPWISHTLDFWLQFCEKKSAAYTWMFTVCCFSGGAIYVEGFGARQLEFENFEWKLKVM